MLKQANSVKEIERLGAEAIKALFQEIPAVEAWNKPRPFRQRYDERWNWPEAITEVKTEKVISIDEILEGFNGL